MSEDPGSTSLEIAVILRDPLWRASVPGCEELVRCAGQAVFAHEAVWRGCGKREFAGPVEVSIVLADDALARDLNRTYRQKDRPTNVLSFANDGGAKDGGLGGDRGLRLLGDVVLARETVLSEARDQGKSGADHMCHLVVHGILHLLEFDHDDRARAEQMEAIEVAVLAAIGIDDPYRPTRLKAVP